MKPGQAEDNHEYVEFLLDVKDGKIVSCEYFGEGRQVEPLTGPLLLRPYAQRLAIERRSPFSPVQRWRDGYADRLGREI
jgi:hypothetical protein